MINVPSKYFYTRSTVPLRLYNHPLTQIPLTWELRLQSFRRWIATGAVQQSPSRRETCCTPNVR